MIKRKFHLLVCCVMLTTIACWLQAQPVSVKDFTIKYKIAKTIETSGGNARAKLSSTEITLAGNRLSITNVLRPGILTTYLSDLTNTGNSQVFLHNAHDSITYEEEYRRKELLDIAPAEGKTGKTEFINEIRTINGWLCKKAIVTFDDTPVTVWYTESYLLKPAGIYYALQSIPGLPVVISFNEGNRLNMPAITNVYNTYMLEKFSVLENPSTAFVIPNAERYRQVGERTERINILQKMLALSPPIMEIPEEMKPFIAAPGN